VREVGDFPLMERFAPAMAIMTVAAWQERPRALRYAAATFGLPEAGDGPSPCNRRSRRPAAR